MNSGRIDSIDGWRILAAVGVLYGHTWALFNNPSWVVAGVNVMQVFYLWGYGVHLFFVISGLCFYLILSRQPVFDWRMAVGFWKKRWLRIAPAFYVACVVYGLANYSRLHHDLIYRLFFNFIFLQDYVPNTRIEGIFWSLAVEGHFYLLLPLIFVLINRIGVLSTVVSILSLHVLLNLWHYKFHYPYKEIPFLIDSWWYTTYCNIGHFAWGILVGYFYTRRKLVKFFSRWWSLPVGLALAYTGRIFIYSHALVLEGPSRYIFQATGPLVMTMGFACMIFSCLENETLSRIWGNRALASPGRVSYSFYLWHTLILRVVYEVFKDHLPWTAVGVFATMGVTLVILIPVSYLSFKLLESFYFRRIVQISATRG
ncbi:MAG TPA: acyltransferase [Puia sp.]|nr:acyltransferase [Puia sp.]